MMKAKKEAVFQESFEKFEFKQNYDEGRMQIEYVLDRRKEEFTKILTKCPNRIPVIIERFSDKTSEDLPLIDQQK